MLPKKEMISGKYDPGIARAPRQRGDLARECWEDPFMFNAVFENLRTATDVAIQTQQDLFKKWIAFWEGKPGKPGLVLCLAAINP